MTYDDTTPEEEEQIKELKSRVDPNLITDKLKEDESLFKRFLRARDHDLDAAERMLKNCLEWRKKNKIDQILSSYNLPEITKYFSLTHLGCDKEGSPIYYVPYGRMDLKNMLKVFSLIKDDKKELICSMVHFLETFELHAKEETKRRNRLIDKYTFIGDFEDLSLSVATNKNIIDYLRAMLAVFESCYPERLKCVYLINCSWIFTFLWTLISPFVDKHTVKKIRIYGKDGYKKDLVENIDAENLPIFLGGTRTGPNNDPSGWDVINFLGAVPEDMLPEMVHSRTKGKKKIVIHRMAKKEIELKVDHPDSIIEWEFVTTNLDIGFSLLYKDKSKTKSELELLIPMHRVETDLASDSRAYRCEKPGIYIIEFNNSYSWIRSKEIHYSARVVSPKELNCNN